jgi:hypothetical protein
MEMLGFSNLFGSTVFSVFLVPLRRSVEGRVDLRSCLDEAILAYDLEDSLERR